MADIKTLAESVHSAAMEYGDACVSGSAGVLKERHLELAAALDALAEAHQAEVARLTRENEGLAKAARDVCEHIHGEFPRTGYLRDNYNSRAALGRLRAALAGASGAQITKDEHGKA